MDSKSRRTPRMMASAAPPPAHTLIAHANPVDPDKPAGDPGPQSEATGAVAAPPSAAPPAITEPAMVETPEMVAEPAMAGPPVLSAAAAAASLPMPVAVADPTVDRDLFAITGESRAALARTVESISDELAGYVRHSIDTTADIAIRMLSAASWSDAMAVNVKFARSSYDQWLDTTAKVSELGVKFAYESAKPLMVRLERMWRGAAVGH